MMKRFARFATGLFLAAGVLGGSAANAAGGPDMWSGDLKGQSEPARVFTDGERAIGGVRVALRSGEFDITLLGLHPRNAADYSGNISGWARGGGKQPAVNGSWRLDLRTRMVAADGLSPTGKFHIDLALADVGLPAPLRCGWALGNVTCRHGSRSGALRMGDAIAVGDTVTTGAQSAAILVLGDRSVAVLQEQTTLVLPAGTYNSGPSIDRVQVRGGKIWFAVRKLGSGQRFEVETGQAVAAVHGTEFVVQDGANGMGVLMADGTVDISDPKGAQAPVRVDAGSEWQLKNGAAAWPAPKLLNLGPVADEWDELLEIADYCWPFRRENRNPFWEDVVDPPAQRANGNLDPFELAELLGWKVPPAALQAGGVVLQPVNNGGNGGNGGRRRRNNNGAILGAAGAVGAGLALGGLLGGHDRDHHDHDDHHKNDGDRGHGDKPKGNGLGSLLRSGGGRRH